VNSFIWKQIWELRYYSDELFNVTFTLKCEIYYSNSSKLHSCTEAKPFINKNQTTKKGGNDKMNRQHYASRFWLSFPTHKHLFSVSIITVFDFSLTFRGVNNNFFFNFSDIFLISPTSDPSDFLLNRAVLDFPLCIHLCNAYTTWNVTHLHGPVCRTKLWSSTSNVQNQ
jgi:hypothetical protein